MAETRAPGARIAIDWAFQLRRGNPAPTDPTDVFDTITDLDDYVTNPFTTAYAGQIVAVRHTDQVPPPNEPDLFTIFEDKTYGQLAAGAAEGVSIGSATAPTTPSGGELWSRPDGRLYIWNPSAGAWIQIS